MIRLTVRPEVSIPDPTLSVSIVPGGDPVPGITTRNASTTVEIREGQTLAIAGLLSRSTTGTTVRVPLLGDLPIVGAFFSETDHDVRETELLVIVTPYMVDSLDSNQCIPLPGQEVMEPCDLELYLLGRIEGRTGLPYRATTNWDDPLGIIRHQQIEQQHVYGPCGFSK
jgi:pilus assembly protein CpaC